MLLTPTPFNPLVEELYSKKAPVGPTVSIISEPTYQSPPPFSLVPEPASNICIDADSASLKNWDLQGRIKDWKVDYFSFDSVDCEAWLRVREVKDLTNGDWGQANFPDYDKMTIDLSAIVPKSHREHVLCHELGHVLGRPHVHDPDSCMNVDRFETTPSKADLRKVVGKDWTWDAAELDSIG